jgi:hypothetical protein
VDAAAATGSVVTLTLAKTLVSGDMIDIAAPGINPAPNVVTQADDVTVQVGNGTVEVTNPIGFGDSVTGVVVTPSFPVAEAQPPTRSTSRRPTPSPWEGTSMSTRSPGRRISPRSPISR